MLNKSEEIISLRPIGEKNAIEEVVFTLHIADGFQVENPEKYIKDPSETLINDFPKYDSVTRHGFRFSNHSSEKMPSKVIGLTFEKYKPDGRLEQRLRGENVEASDGDTSWLAVNILDYDRWAIESKKAYGWLNEILKEQGDIPIAGITLQYIDTMYWESNTSFSFKDIFKPESIYLPDKINENAKKWTSRISYEEQYLDSTDTVNSEVSVSVGLDMNNGYKRIRIQNPLTISYDECVTLNEIISAKIKADFQYLHDENKKITKNLIADNVCKLIGLV